MTELEKLLNEFATLFKTALQYYAKLYVNTKTGKDTLSKSDIVKNLKVSVEDERLIISVYSYWQYIESGRKIGENWVNIDALIQWIKKKKIIRNAKGQFVKNDIKSINALAFVIARSIRKTGISKRPIFTEAYNEASKEIDKKLNLYVDSITKSILLQFIKK